MINEDILNQNLNQHLFVGLFNFTLDALKEAYEEFKQSDDYQILLEDIRRQEKLHDVMIEG